jgi:hypothetical protein
MTIPKTARGDASSDGAPRVERGQPLLKTQELPAIASIVSDGESGQEDSEAVPSAIADGDITVPVQSSIESTLTFEVLRRQSSQTDDDEGVPYPRIFRYAAGAHRAPAAGCSRIGEAQRSAEIGL